MLQRLGFTGNALEGYTVVELLRRALDALVADSAGVTAGVLPVPNPNRLVALAHHLVGTFMASTLFRRTSAYGF